MKFDLENLNQTEINAWLATNPREELVKPVITTLQQAGYFFTKDDSGLYSISTKKGATPAASKKSSGDDFSEILEILTELISISGGVNAEEVNKLIRGYMSSTKISVADLDEQLQNLLNKPAQKFEVVLPPAWKKGVETGDIPEFPQPITDLIISDLSSKIPTRPKGGGNNVYLYGGAGTGKTYIFKMIAKYILNVEIITINCNQFTSPTELVGGQTIEGYQQGKLIEAYASLDVPADKNGYMILLDELPKLDPNTAGVLNDLLSSIRDGSPISDGKLQQWERGDKQLYLVATGNTKLNQADPEYEANERQDMSLVDRFAGSMYKFVVELNSERDMMMDLGCLWIFNYLVDLRFFLQKRDYTNFGFVSRRLMNSLVATVYYYFAMREKGNAEAAKTPQISIETFLDLFDADQQVDIRKNTPYELFMKRSREHLENDEGTHPKNYSDEITTANSLVQKYMAEQRNSVAYMNRYGES